MPTRIKLFGDIERADRYRFIAYRKHLADALMLRGFQNLSIYRHQARLPEGGVVDIVCHHNMNEVSIYMPPIPQPVEERPERKQGIGLLLLIGDEFVGYHYMLWDAWNNEQWSDIHTANSLETIYNEFPPAKDQDDSFIQDTQIGLAEGDFYLDAPSGRPRWWEEMIFDEVSRAANKKDTVTKIYTHPIEGDITNQSNFDQNYVSQPPSDPGCICEEVSNVQVDALTLHGKILTWRCNNTTEMNVWFEWGTDVTLGNTTPKQRITQGDNYSFSERIYPSTKYIAFRFNYECIDGTAKTTPSRSAICFVERGFRDFDGLREYMEGLYFALVTDPTFRYADLALDRCTDTFTEKLHSFMLVANYPTYEGNHYDAVESDRREVKTTANKSIYDVWQYYNTTHYHSSSEERLQVWKTPIGYLKQKRRIAQYKLKNYSVFDEDYIIEKKPWDFYYTNKMDIPKNLQETEFYLFNWHRGVPRNQNQLSTSRANPTATFYPDIENKTFRNAPDAVNYNILGNKTIEGRYSEKGAGFQIYTSSYVEWVGVPNSNLSTTDDPAFEELCRYDIINVAAACNQIRNPRTQSRTPAFEEAIAKLIDKTTQDQRNNANISEVNQHTSYRGYLHAYFVDFSITNIFDQPRSKDAERLKLLNLVNQARIDNGLDPVKYNWDLEKAGIRFTFDMIDDLHIGHAGQDGSDALQRQIETGFFINAENHTTEMVNNNTLPKGGGENTGYIGTKIAEDIFDAWMDSTGHKAQILNSDWNNGAMGADYRLGSDDNYYWAQEFAYNPNY